MPMPRLPQRRSRRSAALSNAASRMNRSSGANDRQGQAPADHPRPSPPPTWCSRIANQGVPGPRRRRGGPRRSSGDRWCVIRWSRSLRRAGAAPRRIGPARSVPSSARRPRRGPWVVAARSAPAPRERKETRRAARHQKQPELAQRAAEQRPDGEGRREEPTRCAAPERQQDRERLRDQEEPASGPARQSPWNSRSAMSLPLPSTWGNGTERAPTRPSPSDRDDDAPPTPGPVAVGPGDDPARSRPPRRRSPDPRRGRSPGARPSRRPRGYGRSERRAETARMIVVAASEHSRAGRTSRSASVPRSTSMAKSAPPSGTP